MEGSIVLNKTATTYRPLRTSADLSGSAVTVHRRSPPLDLADYVMEFWEYEVDPEVDCVPIQVFPNGCVSLRFNINELGVEPVLYGPSLQNKMRGWFFHDWVIFGAVLLPDKAYHLLGLGLHEIRDLRITMDCFWPNLMPTLCAQMEESTSFDQRVTTFSDFLRRVLRPKTAPKADFINAFHSIVGAAPHAQDIGLVAKQSGTSGRSLRRQFAKYLGFGPKQMDRLARVQLSMNTLHQAPGYNLAALSAAAGYSDQAHFGREFRAFTSMSPSRFAALIGTMHHKELDNWSGMSKDYRHKLPPKVIRFS